MLDFWAGAPVSGPRDFLSRESYSQAVNIFVRFVSLFFSILVIYTQ